ncbi:MAG: ribose 5-phosphate isomerase B [Rickettsiales bacterium]|nr:ribose 5-phosphate isomerase B [Rickettsiales bacterium]
MKKVAIACDRAGVELKNFLIQSMKSEINFVDLGTDSDEPVDYPDFAKRVVKNILDETVDFGVLICGTGIGMSISANRYKGIRAGLCHNSLEARLTREHNDANILCMGARIIGNECALENLKVFLNTDFAGGRHLRRIEKLEVTD